MTRRSGVATGDLVFVGDVHLDAGDPAVSEFTGFLDSLRDHCATVVLMGDLFNLWIGRQELEGAHHREVANKLTELRRDGVRVVYVEGNRDYRIGDGYLGTAFDEVAGDEIQLTHGGRRIVAAHGDLANPDDVQYRRWRRLSRTRLVWGVFNAVPRRSRRRLAESLERRMRRTNLAFRVAFPERRVREYAARLMRDGGEAIVLGHFHVEKELATVPPAPAGKIFVLPEWKGSRRYLRVTAAGEMKFVDS